MTGTAPCVADGRHLLGRSCQAVRHSLLCVTHRAAPGCQPEQPPTLQQQPGALAVAAVQQPRQGEHSTSAAALLGIFTVILK